jgi:DNA-directed RNA polymerase subunit RPC12/RpoP
MNSSPPPLSPPHPPTLQRQFPCRQCGASLEFQPGHDSLKCPYCGTENVLVPAAGVVTSLDFETQLQALAAGELVHELLTVRCNGCGAETTLPPDTTAGLCPFCASPIVAEAATHKGIRPQSLLPFEITKQQAGEHFRKWVADLWFAPSSLAASAERSAINGTYLPAWTYDSDTYSEYTGQRGDDYWDTEEYTEEENGHTVTRTRQVLRTRWSSVSGRVSNRFDNVLVMATTSLPAKYLSALTPWDLGNLVPYADEYLSGFLAESYQINLIDGFTQARQIMDHDIRRSVESDIGGDHQQVGSVDTQYANVGFKHLLLPVWISAYRYQNKVYRFLVNARTGEVRGERPYSAMKIALAILAVLFVIAVIILLAQR